MIVLISIFTFGLLSTGASVSVQAAVPEDSTNTITLEKTVQFEDLQGEEVLVPPGSYAVTAGKETLQLVDTEANTTVIIEADESSHNVELPTPTAASIPGQEGPLANTHVVMLFLPDGQALQKPTQRIKDTPSHHRRRAWPRPFPGPRTGKRP